MKLLQRAVLVATVVLGAALAAPVGAGASNGLGGARYYLALGDSLAFGYQPVDRTDAGHHGYVDQLFAAQQATYHDLSLVNLACPGETTTTMVSGGRCAIYPDGSQLQQAVNFLKAHRGHVAFATIDIGGNDIDGCATATGINATCIAAGFASTETNLPAIMTALRAASPDTQWVGMNYYDPFLAAALQGPSGVALANQSVALLVSYNAELAQIYGGFGVPVADVATAFHSLDTTAVASPPAPLPAGTPTNVVYICADTWMCALGDIHANATGYGLIADAFAAELKR